MVKLASDALVKALETRCVAGGHRLTPLRREVLALLIKHEGRATAYELIDDLPTIGRRASPASVYRALEFLMRIGLVKRLLSTSTFIVAEEDSKQVHAIFLVCALCGTTENLIDAPLERVLSEAAQTMRYDIHGRQTEVSGICSACQLKRHVGQTREGVPAQLLKA
jgi:Fur family transcriptional regulator, zinc uptake regulator